MSSAIGDCSMGTCPPLGVEGDIMDGCCWDDGVRGVLYIGLVIPPCGKPPGVVLLAAEGVNGL